MMLIDVGNLSVWRAADRDVKVSTLYKRVYLIFIACN